MTITKEIATRVNKGQLSLGVATATQMCLQVLLNHTRLTPYQTPSNKLL